MLGPTRIEVLNRRLESLRSSRAEVLLAADEERRRIERDLHDGAQQRLMSLALNLGMAREAITEPSPAREAIVAAHEEAMLALTELRHFVRGLHPAVLEDRGLDAAISGIAARSPIPVEVSVDIGRRCPGTIEAIAYFIVSEALTNVTRHASATQASVDVRRHGGRAGRHGAGRRPWWCHHQARWWSRRPRSARRRGRRRTESRQPGRWADDRRGGAAVRVILAEDSVLLRAGLTKLLTDGGFDVVDAVGDGEELLRSVAEHGPDLVVVDVRMPPTHTDEGIRAALAIRRLRPDIAILVLSQYVEERYATDLLSAATSSVGYLLKDRVARVGDFLDALRRVAAGGTALDPEVVTQLMVRRRARIRGPGSRPASWRCCG
nr:hypothetical protein GCM10020092_021180 [Actinoplanes digitatis]